MEILYLIRRIIGWIAVLSIPIGIIGIVTTGSGEFLGSCIGACIIALIAYFILSLFTKTFWKGLGEAAQSGELLRGATGRCPECRLKVSGFAKKCPHCTSDISSSSYIK